MIAWTPDAATLRPDPDAYVQRHLYLGAFMTAPLATNDHTITPTPELERLYLDYGPLFDAIRARRWILQPRVVESPAPAKANVFQTPRGYTVVVCFAGTDATVPVTLRGLNLDGATAECITPHQGHWSSLGVSNNGGDTTLQVPTSRGCGVVRITPRGPPASPPK